ncbi:MAG: D-alanyl-D-alanine carboxypeptidase [Legionellaceae bacterium]|nr:D-alanyl-D-alanine carboxypeptidase [Legionellaceae bacterium]
MKKLILSPIKLLLFTCLVIHSSIFYANSLSTTLKKPTPVTSPPQITPSPPNVNSKAYILIDANSGKVIAEKNSEQRLPPASLTKLMTLYVVSKALDNQQIHLEDNVRISKAAWKIGGSRMFVKEGQMVSIENLLKGIIVDSGNDACMALSEHVGGSEVGFTDLMNNQAKNLGMNNSHFTDTTGLPNKDLYTTAKDLSILSQALVNNFPQYYHWYKEKWFTFNGIRQPNRNRLLWRDGQVDGIKTGHTNDAGYCLVSSAKRGDMRLIAVVLNAPTETTRADDSERLLNYGFRFFETRQLYKANQAISKVKLYKGNSKTLDLGVQKNYFITIPSGQYKRLAINTKVPQFVEAPITKGQKVGELIVKFDDKIISEQPLYALTDEKSGGFYKKAVGSIQIMFARWFG